MVNPTSHAFHSAMLSLAMLWYLHTHPGWGPETEGYQGQQCHSQDCSVHNNQRQLDGPEQ